MRRSSPGKARRLLAGGVVSVMAASCSAAGIGTAPTVHPVGPTVTFVAVGGTDFLGPGGFRDQDWADLVYASDFGAAATLYDLNGRDETLSEALSDLVPEAVALHPAVAAVWLGAADALEATPPARYRAELTRLVRQLGGGGNTRVLLADLPPLDLYPGYDGCLAAPRTCGLGPVGVPPVRAERAVIAADNAITDQVAAEEGARLVPLNRALTLALTGTGPAPVATSQGLALTAAGNALVARVFGSLLPARLSGTGRRRT